MPNVITYGTFDLFHFGHLRLLERAKALTRGEGELIVAVSTDTFNWEAKRKTCVVPYAERAAIVAALRCVDRVIAEESWEQKAADITQNQVGIFVMGDDWRGKFDDLGRLCKVVYLPRTPNISSTEMKQEIVGRTAQFEPCAETLATRLKAWVKRVLKPCAVGRLAYPAVQRLYRAIAIPMRRRRLQRHGADVLGRIHALLTRYHVPYYCDYGTLLGFVRDKGFMPHDDDIDISIPPGNDPVAILRLFLEAGFGFIHAFDYQGRLIEFSVMDATQVSIDVFFPDIGPEPGTLYGYQPIWEPRRAYPSEKANTLIRYRFAAPTALASAEAVGRRTVFPQNADEVLTSEYGPWQIPDAHFSTVHDRVHEELPGFAFRLSREEALAHATKPPTV